MTGFSPAIRDTYQLSPDQLTGVQFFVGIVDDRGRILDAAARITLSYRSSQTDRQSANAGLATKVVVTEKDFVIWNSLPGVFVQQTTELSDSLLLNIGSEAVLTFQRLASQNAPYVLRAINGSPYTVGSRIRIADEEYIVTRAVPSVLLFNEKNVRKVFRKTIAAEGARVRQ